MFLKTYDFQGKATANRATVTQRRLSHSAPQSLASSCFLRQDEESCARDEQKHILSSYPVKRIIHRQAKATESAVVFSRDSVFIDLLIIYKRFDSPDYS